MNKNIKKEYSLKEIQDNLSKLKGYLKRIKKKIFTFLDESSIQYHQNDFRSCLQYLDWLRRNKDYIQSAVKMKPYGRTLVILPSNEPIKMAIIPVISGLFGGGRVEIKCHDSVKKLQSLIYKQFIKSGFKNISVLPFGNNQKDYKKLRKLIQGQHYQNVVCFASHKVAEKIGKICLKKGVNFHFECEGNDWLILDYLPEKKKILEIVKAAIAHQGKMCNCLKGVLIKAKYYNIFLDKIKKISINKKLQLEIIENPLITSRVVQNPEFRPSLWLKKFTNISELLKYLNSNKNRLVLHIWSKNKNFIKTIIKNTSFARYNLTPKLLIIDFNEPWGGIFLSGNKGPIQWYERFGYTPVIKFK